MSRRSLMLTLAVVGLVVQGIALYRPTAPSGAGIPGLDKLGHALIFAVPVFFFIRAGVRSWLVALLAVIHAVLSELIQANFYRYRSGDPWDVIADCVGIGIGWGVARLLGRRR